jgi:arabinose-5-phosphate isomerase
VKLKTVEDLMLTKKKIPFISENSNMKQALKIISQKKLGTLIVKNSRGVTTGMITDGTVRRTNEKNKNLQKLSVRSVMTKNPISVNGEMLAEKALGIMTQKKITSLCVNNSKNKTIGILHIHNILDAKIQ